MTNLLTYYGDLIFSLFNNQLVQLCECIYNGFWDENLVRDSTKKNGLLRSHKFKVIQVAADWQYAGAVYRASLT